MVKLSKIRERLAKKFGSDSVLVDKELQSLAHMPYGIHCQAAMVDTVIGRPGFPAGRITEIMGQEASSKSTLGYHTLAEVQRIGGIGILIETEEAFETKRLKKLGIKIDDLIICQPKHMEEAFEMMVMNIREIRKEHDGPICVVWDSVASTPVLAETENEYDEDTMGAAARFLSKAMRKFVRFIAEQKVVIIFINQLKTNLDRYSGEKWISYGGKAVKFHSSIRLIVSSRKSDLELKGKEPAGQWFQVRNVKNKIGTPYKATRFFLNFKKGIDKYRDAKEFGIFVGVFKPKNKGVTLYKKHVISKKKWKEFVKEKWGNATKCREWLVDKAIEKKMLEKYDPAELKKPEEKKKRGRKKVKK